MKKGRVKFPQGPIRMCVVCQHKYPKTELVRLGVENNLICSHQKGNGRGVYICRCHSQVQINKKRKRIFHLLGCQGEYEISLSSGRGVQK